MQYPSPEWDSVTTAAKELIDGLLDRNQDTRLTAETALNSVWIMVRGERGGGGWGLRGERRELWGKCYKRGRGRVNGFGVVKEG